MTEIYSLFTSDDIELILEKVKFNERCSKVNDIQKKIDNYKNLLRSKRQTLRIIEQTSFGILKEKYGKSNFKNSYRYGVRGTEITEEEIEILEKNIDELIDKLSEIAMD